MARSFPLLLLAMLLPAAFATVGLQQAAPCEPALTAAEISRVCPAGRPTAQCCGLVMAVVELGGGVPCLCRVAAEPELAMAGLNAKRLFSSCGGARLTAACEGPSPPVAVVKGMHLARRNLVAAPVRSNATCPSATEMATEVAIDCGQSIPEQAPCCAALKQAVSVSKVMECICTLERAEAIQDVKLTARDLVNDYSKCMSIRPGDVHFPTDGCRSVLLETQGTPPPAAVSPSPPVAPLNGPLSASPPSNPYPAKEQATAGPVFSSKDHAILVAILVLLAVACGLACIGVAVYAVCQMRGGGWMLLGRGRAQGNQPQPNIIMFNNVPQTEAPASTSSTSDTLSNAVDNVMRHTAELQNQLRRSGRLAGQPPSHSGLE